SGSELFWRVPSAHISAVPPCAMLCRSSQAWNLVIRVERHGPESQSHVVVGTSKPRAGAPEPGRRLGRAARPPAVSSALAGRRARRAAHGNRRDGRCRRDGRQPGRSGTIAVSVAGGKTGGERVLVVRARGTL